MVTTRVQSLYEQLSIGEWRLMRQTLCSFFQDKRIKVLLLKSFQQHTRDLQIRVAVTVCNHLDVSTRYCTHTCGCSTVVMKLCVQTRHRFQLNRLQQACSASCMSLNVQVVNASRRGELRDSMPHLAQYQRLQQYEISCSLTSLAFIQTHMFDACSVCSCISLTIPCLMMSYRHALHYHSLLSVAHA